MPSFFPTHLQPDSKDCGPTCLKIIAKHYGKTLNIQTLRNLSETTREGSNLLNISDWDEKIVHYGKNNIHYGKNNIHYTKNNIHYAKNNIHYGKNKFYNLNIDLSIG